MTFGMIPSMISVCLAMTLTACANPTGLPLQGQPVDLQATTETVLPTYSKGSWYAYNDGSREIVVDVVGETVLWEDEKGRVETRYRNLALPRLKWVLGETKVLADPGALWPLEPGNSVRFNELRNEFDLTRRLTARKTRIWYCTVKDPTVLATEVGSFDTYPIACQLRSSGRSGKLLETRIWYFAPDVGHYVRREKIDDIGTIQIRELVAHG